MAVFSASGNQNLSSSTITALTILANASTANRTWINEFIIADEGTPADNVVLHTVARATAEGTATEVVPTRMDVADREAQSNVGENHSGEPTYTSTEEVLEFALNTRATFRWVAAPDSEIIVPATNNNGIHIISFIAENLPIGNINIMHEE